MKLYTMQLGQWRKAKAAGIPLLDVTVKSGDARLAPTWGLLAAYKAGEVNNEQYTVAFKETLRVRYKDDYARWLEIANMESVALACYCKGGEFCHRLLLVDMLAGFCKQHQIPFEYLGELQ